MRSPSDGIRVADGAHYSPHVHEQTHGNKLGDVRIASNVFRFYESLFAKTSEVFRERVDSKLNVEQREANCTLTAQGENQQWSFTGDFIKSFQWSKHHGESSDEWDSYEELSKGGLDNLGLVKKKERERMGTLEQSFCKSYNGVVLCLRDAHLLYFRMSKRRSKTGSQKWKLFLYPANGSLAQTKGLFSPKRCKMVRVEILFLWAISSRWSLEKFQQWVPSAWKQLKLSRPRS